MSKVALDPPQRPLKRGENLLKVPLFKGDLGGSLPFKRLDYDFSDILLALHTEKPPVAGLLRRI